MCDAVTKSADESGEQDACAVCGLMPGNNCVAVYEDPKPDYRRVEDVVMRWAAENPEPAYPTWWEWLLTIGVAPEKVSANMAFELTDTGLMDPIPAEFAQKFGIESKE